MIMRSTAVSIVVLALAACGPGLAKPDQRIVATDALAAASGNTSKIRALLARDVALGGLWFPPGTACAALAAPAIVSEAKLDFAAACLSTLKWRASARKDALPDVTVLEVEPGFELEARVVAEGDKQRLSFIGFASRGRDDTAPTITPAMLETLRIAGDRRITPPPGVERPARAWMRVCLDETGAVTARPLLTSRLAAQDAFAAGIATWRFKPLELGGAPTPACASLWFSDPLFEHETLPLLPPSPIDGRAYVVLEDPRTVKRLTSDRETLAGYDLDRSRRRGVLEAGFRLCVDTAGHVHSVLPTAASVDPTFDAHVATGMKRWQYEPLLVDGQPNPFCVHVKFRLDVR